MKVLNVADYAWTRKYMVVRKIDGELWFYDAWDDYRNAHTQSWEINNGAVVLTDEVEEG